LRARRGHGGLALPRVRRSSGMAGLTMAPSGEPGSDKKTTTENAVARINAPAVWR